MRISEATRGRLVAAAFACIAVGLLAFAATDALWARAAYEQIDAARAATPAAGWRNAAAPDLPFASLFDVLGAAGAILLVVMTIGRALPDASRARVHVAVGLLALGVVMSLAGNAVDRTHDHEAAWGAIQLGLVGLALASLVWNDRVARALALAGAMLLAARQPAIWSASDAFVRATGDASLAYGAELWRVAAHAIGAAGAALLAIALLVHLARARRARKAERAGGALPDARDAGIGFASAQEQ